MKNKPSLPIFANVVVALSIGLCAVANAQEAKPGDPAAGQKKAEMCNGCHAIDGYRGSFPEVYKVPKIAGQNAEYIVAALTEYRKGERKHPSMRAIAGSLSDQDMADLAAYFEQLGKAGQEGNKQADAAAHPAPAHVASLLEKANCASCHGANFSKPITPAYPKLAGQYADYLYYALKAYQTDHNALIGRNNAIMMGMARPFTHAQLRDIADYLASLPGELKTVQQPRFR